MNLKYMCTKPFLAEVILVKTCMAASSSQAAKKQKLERLEDFRRGVPFVTCSALSAILGKVEKEGVPELHGRKNLKEAVQERLASMAGDHGPVIKNLEAVKIGEGHWNFPVLNLPAMLQGLYKQEGYWHDYFANKHMHDPSSLQSPWKGIIYADEVHPGNMLASSGRKIWCVYFSWLNLQQQGLSEEKHWFTLTVLRTEEVQKLDGGIGQVLRLILEDMFAPEFGSPLHGIVMKSSQSFICLPLDSAFVPPRRQCSETNLFKQARHRVPGLHAVQKHIQCEDGTRHGRRRKNQFQTPHPVVLRLGQ